ncbi:hypothetical protein [Streptomyces sp. NPDC057287]|uniref:hypothetical protein n=1 Tax=Streptomyces sp. NPDC057287 TaxID=3346086 RepID=UPI00364003F3
MFFLPEDVAPPAGPAGGASDSAELLVLLDSLAGPAAVTREVDGLMSLQRFSRLREAAGPHSSRLRGGRVSA